MTDSRSHIQMALKSIESFANDGKLSAKELNEIIEIAEQDGVIDQNEVRVFRSIISRLDPTEVSDDLRDKLAELSKKISRKRN